MFEEEAPKSERLFSQLTTAWYNWAVAEMLHHREVHCWEMTAAYYSMVHAARTPMSLTSYYRSHFVRVHSKFPKFLSGEEYFSEHNKAVNELAEELGEELDDIEKLFYDLYRVLDTFRKARDMTSYEQYVIAHQIRGDIEASAWLQEICKMSHTYAVSINKRISELVYRYVRRHKFSAYYLYHLKEEIVQFNDLLRNEQLTTPSGLAPIINEFNYLIAQVKEPMDINNFIEKTWDYPSKDEAYKRLHSVLLSIQKLDA